MNRISEKYRPLVSDIARIYVECEGNKSACARRVRAEVKGGESFKAEQLARWLKQPEFEALVREAEEGAANAKRARPSIRGPERIAWLLAVEKELKTRHHEALDEKTKDAALGASLKVGAEIRAEELHYEQIQERAAKRGLTRLVKNLILFARKRHADVLPTLDPVFRDFLNNLDAVYAGRVPE